VKRGKVNLFLQNRNPVIYGGAIDRLEQEGGGGDPNLAGTPVFVSDWKGDIILGWGFFNPSSMYRVRIMEFFDAAEQEGLKEGEAGGFLSQDSVSKFLFDKISDAYAARVQLNLPSKDVTDAYRLVNSEGDDLSGLIVDSMGRGNFVVQSSGAWVERYKEVIMLALASLTPEADLIAWKADAGILKKEGLEIEENFQLYKITKKSEDGAQVSSFEKLEGFESDSEAREKHMHVTVLENSVKYSVGLNMQKTGFYCDQRKNRMLLKSLAKGKSVLDLCCYTGGFGISAALGGASDVTGVDSSSKAISVAQENAALNGVEEVMRFHAEDISKFMNRSLESGEQWNIVVLDPPKLCPSAKFLKQALRKYEKLNSMAMQLVSRGGVLITCSCSGAVTRSDNNTFLGMLNKAATRAGRDVKVLQVSGASEDHLTSLRYPEGEYLTVATLLIM
jgi:23S rRNA G2069 N7-methylase RlmK/C1962 C5-methylase RlmI